MEPNTGSVRKALAWAGLGQGAFFILQFGSTVLLARLLSPREMGIFALGAATVGLVSALQALGLNNFIIRAENVDRSMLATAFTVNLVLSLLVAAGIGLTGLYSEHLFREPGALEVMLWMATTPVIAAIGLVPTSLLQREGDFRALSLLRILSTFVGNLLTVALALAGWSYMSLTYGWVTTCAINALGACVLAPRHIHFRLSLRDWRAVSRFGASMFFVNATTQAQRQVLNLILGRFQGIASVGLFSRASSLFNLLLENTQTVLMRVFLYDFAAAARRGAALDDRYRRVIELMTALLWPVFAGLAVLANPIIRLLYGHKWEGLGPSLAMLCVSGIFWVSIAMAWELFVVANETGKQARIELHRSLVGAAAFLLGAQFSLNWAAASRIFEAVYSIFLYGPHIRRITGCTTRSLLPIYARSGLLTVAAVAPATLLMLRYGWSPETPVWAVFSSVALGVVLWLVTMLLLGHSVLEEFKRLRGRSAARREARA